MSEYVSREEFESLKKLVNSLIKRCDIDKNYASADTAGLRHTDNIQSENISTNANDISDNRAGIEESYEASLTNTEDIADVRTALEEVYEMIDTKEE